MTEWLKQNTVSIIVGGFGLIGGFYVHQLNQQVSVYENGMKQNKIDIDRCMTDISELKASISKNPDYKSYESTLQEHEAKLQLIYNLLVNR